MQKIKQYIQGGGIQALALPETFLRCFNDLYSRQCLSSAGLAVNASTTLYQITNATFVVLGGVTQLVAAVSAAPALTGYNLTSGQVGGVVCTVDASGVVRNLQINPGAALSFIGWPEVPAGQVAVGAVLINAVNAATFTGGTTLMSATSVSYLNFTGPFNPTNAF